MTLNLSKVSDSYFKQLFVNPKGDPSVTAKAKVLLMDSHTTSAISMCYTQTQLLMNDIVLIDLINNCGSLKSMSHLNCIIYIKPTKDSLSYVEKELRAPHFGGYELYLNSTISKGQLEEVAKADEFEVVSKVMELFQDYLIVNSNLFQVSLSQENNIIEEANSLSTLLLSIGKCPIIKYDESSLDLKKLSSEILYGINSNSNNNLFEDLNKTTDVPPMLLLLDRKFDLITPLVTPWTYQSMIHELIGIKNNVVAIRETGEQLVLSETQDAFFHESMYLNYGDLTDKFQSYVEKYKKQTKQSSIENLKTQNLAELKRLLTSFPEFKKLLNNILKHLSIITELDKQITEQNLWEVGELQQIILGDFENHLAIKEKIMELLENPKISVSNKIKIILIYISKFPDNKTDTAGFCSVIQNPAFNTKPASSFQVSLIKEFSKFAVEKGERSRGTTPGNIGSIFANRKVSINHLFGGASKQNATNNIYMQYIPRLHKVLSDLINPGDIQGSRQPRLSTLIPDVVARQYGNIGTNVQDIIIYIKGGVTYEEARLINDYSASNDKINLIIGGDHILNSEQCLKSLDNELRHNAPSSISESDEPTFRQFRDIL